MVVLMLRKVLRDFPDEKLQLLGGLVGDLMAVRDHDSQVRAVMRSEASRGTFSAHESMARGLAGHLARVRLEDWERVQDSGLRVYGTGRVEELDADDEVAPREPATAVPTGLAMLPRDTVLGQGAGRSIAITEQASRERRAGELTQELLLGVVGRQASPQWNCTAPHRSRKTRRSMQSGNASRRTVGERNPSAPLGGAEDEAWITKAMDDKAAEEIWSDVENQTAAIAFAAERWGQMTKTHQ